MLSSLKLSLIKLVVFAIVLLYLASDLMFWDGPVWRALNPESGRELEPAAARLFGEPIRPEALDYAAKQDAYLRGKESAEPSRRATVLQQLLEAEMLRVRAHYNDLNLPSRKAEAAAEYARLESRYADAAAFEARLTQLGETPQSFRAGIEARLREQFLVERAVQKLVLVNDDELARYYEDLKEQLRLPEQRELSHIFVRKLGKENAQQEAEHILECISNGATFDYMALQMSDDSASSRKHGALGLISDDARRPLPEIALFGENAIPAGVPTLVESTWGWHIILAGPIKPSHIPTFEECRESLRSALESVQREQAVRAYLDTAFAEALSKKNLIYYPDVH